MFVRWQNVSSVFFNIANGVQEGGIWSPFLFRFYIRDLIARITNMYIGCCYNGMFINLLAFADDMVIFAPSWHGLQTILYAVEEAAGKINMTFNTKKTVCMTYNPCNRHKIVCYSHNLLLLAVNCSLLTSSVTLEIL